jgi:hypothetical protein
LELIRPKKIACDITIKYSLDDGTEKSTTYPVSDEVGEFIELKSLENNCSPSEVAFKILSTSIAQTVRKRFKLDEGENPVAEQKVVEQPRDEVNG